MAATRESKLETFHIVDVSIDIPESGPNALVIRGVFTNSANHQLKSRRMTVSKVKVQHPSFVLTIDDANRAATLTLPEFRNGRGRAAGQTSDSVLAHIAALRGMPVRESLARAKDAGK